MPNVQIPPGLSESDDVDHDQTQGGTEGNPHGDSAASGDVSSIQSSSDVNHDNTSGGTAGNPHSGSASDNHGNGAHNASFETESGAQSRVNSHENKNNPHSSSADTNHGNEAHNATFAEDGDAQPPENHGNGAHNANFAVDGDAQPPENHGNGAHFSNYITDAGVTSVNGQSGSVSVQEDDLAWTRQAEYQLSNIEGGSAGGDYFEYPIPNTGDTGVTGVRLAFPEVTIVQAGQETTEFRLRVGSSPSENLHPTDGEMFRVDEFRAIVELNTVGGVTFFNNTSFTTKIEFVSEGGFISAPLEGNGVTFSIRYLDSGSVVVWTR